MKKSVLCLVILLFAVQSVLAELVITQPDALYNRGDAFNVSAYVIKSTSTHDFVSIRLTCENESVELYKSPFSVGANEQKSVGVATTLDRFVLGSLLGSCTLQVHYGNEQVESRNFTITSVVDVSLQTLPAAVDPATSLLISGTAVKKNGKSAQGFAEVQIPDLKLSTIVPLSAGNFSASLHLPGDAKSGGHTLLVRAYEKESDDSISNEGTSATVFRITQIPRSLAIASNAGSIRPGGELIYTLLVYDQAGDAIKTAVPVRISNPDGSLVKEQVVATGEAQSLLALGNTTPGSWNIAAVLGALHAQKQFAVEAVENVSFSLSNTTLTITNIGNVPYTKPVEVTIGETKEVKQVSLGVGEGIRFRLGAPDGSYPISASSNGTVNSLGNAFLTGDAISVQENQQLLLSSIPWIWLILIIILGILAIWYYQKMAKKEYIGTSSEYAVQTSQATSGIEYGEKQKAGVVALRVKNEQSAKGKESTLHETLRKAVDGMKAQRLHVVRSGEYIIGIAAPALTKSQENAISAVQAAFQVKKQFDEHNARLAQKIQYGLGVHEGELIVDYRNGVFKFNALGNSMSFAKKMADKAEQEVLISNPVHAASRSRAKVERKESYWKVYALGEQNKHTAFISKFMERQGSS